MIRICLWSGPRNISTALMYSFAQRSDTRVVDEPLYGHYLRVSGVEHPGRKDVLAAMETDGEKVVAQLIMGPSERPVLFMKQMAHHLVELDREFLRRTVNVLLIRNPRDVLMSLVNQIPEPRLVDTGIGVQSELYLQLRAMGQDPPVIDSRELLLAPREVLSELLECLGLPFEEAMLQWSAGSRPEDGVWAPHWYDNVHRSTGFAPYRAKTEPFPERLSSLLDECKPYYERLFAAAIRAPEGDGPEKNRDA
jgi:hypothetical protein